MSIQVRPLLGPYAQAAGEMIRARVVSFGALPDALAEAHSTWEAAHDALGAAPAGAGAQQIDPFVDRVVLLPAYICQEILRAYADVPIKLTERQAQRAADARTLLDAFGDDLRSLVNVPFIEEWAAVGDLLRRLREEQPLVAAIARLGLADDIDLCARLHAVYGQALGLSSDTPRDSREARVAAWNSAYRELLVGASFLERKHPGLLDVFAAPHAAQLRKQQEAGSRQRAAHGAKTDGTTDKAPVG